MSENSVTVDASADDVFALVTDPMRYPGWVVGARDVLEVDEGWPEAGASFSAVLGVGPARVVASTTCVEVAAGPRRILLNVPAVPPGRALATITVEPAEDLARSVVTLTEEPTIGLAAMLHNQLLDAAAHLRNAVSLVRLKMLVERNAR